MSKTKKISQKQELRVLRNATKWFNKYLEDRKLQDDFKKFIDGKRNNTNS